MWEKASTLLHRNFVSNVPGMPNGKMVPSTNTPHKPHIVTAVKGDTCDCINYKSKSMCSHVIASAVECYLPYLAGFLVQIRNQACGSYRRVQEYRSTLVVNLVSINDKETQRFTPQVVHL